jgi:di/tricarboxylate transporter
LILDGLTLQMAVTFAAIVIAIGCYAAERLSLEVTSVGLIGFLLVFFHFFPVAGPGGKNALDAEALLSGFANPALIAVLALLVIGQGIIQTGALNGLIGVLLKHIGTVPRTAIAVTLLLAAAISGFLNDTPVVVIFIPIMAVIADRLRISPSKVMIPISYAVMLGGITTLIGSSTNMLVSGALERAGGASIGFFDFTVPALFMAGIGLLYVVFVVPLLLPDRASIAGSLVGASGRHFIAQIDVKPGSPLVGEVSVAGMFVKLPGVTVQMIQRGDLVLLPLIDEVTLRPGDAVIVAATRKALTDLIANYPGVVQGVSEIPEDGSDAHVMPIGDRIMVEAIVAPASRIEGRTVGQIAFHGRTGCIILGVQRRSKMIRTDFKKIRLEAGDGLLILGKREDIGRLRVERDVILVEGSLSEVPAVQRAARALAIFAGVVLASATDLVPIVISSLVGVTLMVMTGCLNVHQAFRAVDRRIMMIVGAALAMGSALEATHGAAYLANVLVTAFDGNSATVTLSAFFLLVAILTQVLSNNASAVLFTPIAYGIALKVGCDPKIFAYAVIFASNCSFATPIGYQTNLLVMGPGHYRFSDFIRVGVPLLLIQWLAFSFFAPWYYGL